MQKTRSKKTKPTKKIKKEKNPKLSPNRVKESDSSNQYTPTRNPSDLKFIDLFCGIGGFRIAADEMGWKCVFSSDIDEEARRVYQANFQDLPHGDITKIAPEIIPDHDVLLAGFPCQPFSIIGQRKGFVDTRGTLFFEIAKILSVKKPKVFVLENVKQLASNNKGETLKRILEVLRELNYSVEYHILNALNFGLPQKRERIVLVGMRGPFMFHWPKFSGKMKSLTDILETKIPSQYYVSDKIKQKRLLMHKSKISPSIWHENKAGHISSYPYSCALRANGSYNYLLVDGIRRMTPRELLRLQGFPETFKIVCNYSQTRKQAGNAVPVPMIQAILQEIKRVWPIIMHERDITVETEESLKVTLFS